MCSSCPTIAPNAKTENRAFKFCEGDKHAPACARRASASLPQIKERPHTRSSGGEQYNQRSAEKRERLQLSARHKMPLAILNGREQYEKCDLREPAGVEKRLLHTAPSPYRSHLSRATFLVGPSAALPLTGTDLDRKAHSSSVPAPTITEPITTEPGGDGGERGVAKTQAGLSKTDKQLGRSLHKTDLTTISNPALQTNSYGLLCILIPEPAKTQAHSRS